MTNYRQYQLKIVKAELERKQSTCKLASESPAVEKVNLICFLVHMSKQGSEEWGVAGGGGGRQYFALLPCLSVVQAARSLCNRVSLFVRTLAGLREQPLSDSASHVCFWWTGKLSQVLLLFSIDSVRRGVHGVRRWAGGWQSDSESDF